MPRTHATQSWRDDPHAVLLLRACAEDHPRLHEFRYAFGETDIRYKGALVTKLNGIYERWGQKLIREADASGDYTAFSAWADDSVTKAITDAITEAAERRAAA